MASGLAAGAGLESKTVFDGDYPKAMYFRYVAPGATSAPTADAQWVKRWQFLDGLIVSALDDYILDLPNKIIPKVNLYKATYPDKIALLHINGKSRYPLLRNPKLSPLHFLTFAGTRGDGPLKPESAILRVANAQLFKTKVGRGGRGRDDLVITALTAEGRPDWSRYEYARLKSVDNSSHKLIVERGQYDTQPLRANGYYVAPLVTSGPWRSNTEQMTWLYNFTLPSMPLAAVAPLADVLADEIGGWFAAGGVLKSFDGLEFDVMAETIGNQGRERGTGIDFNADGVHDAGDVNAISRYRLGVATFLARVRQVLGDDKLVLADGHRINHQRSLGALNGIESEAWPNHYDIELKDWSGGLNRHNYWARFARAPRLSYVRVGEFYDREHNKVEIPANMQRLIMAGALLTDSVIVPSNRDAGLPFHKWPELSGGRGRYSSWLGRARVEGQRLQQQGPGLWGVDLAVIPERWTLSGRVEFEADRKLLQVKPSHGANSAKANSVAVELDVPNFSGSDLVLSLEAFSPALESQYGDRPRLLQVQLSGACGSEQSIMSWLGAQPLPAHFYFSDLRWSKGCSMRVTAEGETAFSVQRAALRAQPDVVYRLFEHGLLLANPSARSQSVSLPNAYPGCRLQQVSPRRNTADTSLKIEGQSLRLQVPAKDALFVRADC